MSLQFQGKIFMPNSFSLASYYYFLCVTFRRNIHTASQCADTGAVTRHVLIQTPKVTAAPEKGTGNSQRRTHGKCEDVELKVRTLVRGPGRGMAGSSTSKLTVCQNEQKWRKTPKSNARASKHKSYSGEERARTRRLPFPCEKLARRGQILPGNRRRDFRWHTVPVRTEASMETCV